MYELIKLACAVVVLVCGIFMAACPQAATKKEMREDPEVVAKTRKSGFIMIVCGVLLVVINLVI